MKSSELQTRTSHPHFPTPLCRIKQEDILQSAEAAKDSLQTRVREQEVLVEQGLDGLEISIQVIPPAWNTCIPPTMNSPPLSP